jgi:hypothetical protein
MLPTVRPVWEEEEEELAWVVAYISLVLLQASRIRPFPATKHLGVMVLEDSEEMGEAHMAAPVE